MSTSWSKWNKYKLLRRSATICDYLPETHWLKKETLAYMLDKYSSIIIKPSGSYGGKGVVRASRKQGNIQIHYERSKRTCRTLNSAYATIRKRVGKSAIVQKRIALSKVSGRPFDLRVMVQRKRSSDWVLTGTLAKVAGKGYIVTNVARSKGKVIPVSSAVRRSGIRADHSDVKNRIHDVAMKTVKQLHKTFPKQRVMGIDMGLDNSGKPGIIEVNFNPMTSLFLKLADRSMYRKMMKYK